MLLIEFLYRLFLIFELYLFMSYKLFTYFKTDIQ
jgi:hypothetical protein